MDFIKYASIENHYNGKFIDFVRMSMDVNSVDWIVTEKIHGANYSLWSDGTTVRPAKRTSFIGIDENFYNSPSVFAKYEHAVLSLAKDIGPCAVYGELFGGNYPGIKLDQNVKQVQKEVKYCPHIDFAAFDIWAIDKAEFLPWSDVERLCVKHNIPLVPVIGVFKTLTEALQQPNEFITKVPARYSLADIEGNIAEGLVISPSVPHYLHSGSRVIIKSKNDRFKESAKQEKGVIKPSMLNDDTTNVISIIRNNLTDNRMNAVVSKYGPDEQFVVLLNELVQDAVQDGCVEAFNTLSEEEQKFVRKAVTAEAAQLVKKVKYAA